MKILKSQLGIRKDWKHGQKMAEASHINMALTRDDHGPRGQDAIDDAWAAVDAEGTARDAAESEAAQEPDFAASSVTVLQRSD